MRRVTMFTALMLAAMACTALAGVSAASADETLLCKSPGAYCASGDNYASGTSLKASSTSMKIAAGTLGSLTCSEASLEGKTKAWADEPLPAEVTAWTLSGCVRHKVLGGTENCTTSTEHLPYSGSIAYGEANNGTLSLSGSGGEAGWHFACGSIINCTFSFSSASLAGGNPAQLNFNQSTKRSGGPCPSTSTLTATYTVSSPQPAYVARPAYQGTVFCSANESPCFEHVLPSGTKFEAELVSGTAVSISVPPLQLTCPSSSFSGETTAVAGEGSLPASISSFSMGGCSGSANETCTMTTEGTPYSTTFGWDPWTEHGTAQMLVGGLALRMDCAHTFHCTFYGEPTPFTLTNGSPAILKLDALQLSRTGTFCPSEDKFTAEYQINSPKSLYLVSGE